MNDKVIGTLSDGTPMILPSSMDIIEKMDRMDSDQIEMLEQRHSVRFTSEQIVSRLNHPQLIDTYVYMFDQGGKKVIDLTFKGVMAAAQWWGNLIILDWKQEETESSIRVIIHARDVVSNLDAISGFEQSKFDNNQPDKFAFPKAYSKALRDAYKKLIPIEVFAKMAGLYLEGKQSAELEVTKSSVYNMVEKFGGNDKMVDDYIATRFNNKLTDQLTLPQWQQVRSFFSGKAGLDYIKQYRG